MKRVITVLFCLFFCVANKALAYNLNYFTDDARIVDALEVLEDNGGREVLDNLMDNGVKVIFYNLAMMDPSYADDYAISSEDQMGDRYILINTKYMNAPKEALACLIAHESFHKLKVATLTEEVKCTQKEAEYWHRLKNQVNADSNDEYVKRLNRLEALYLASNEGNNKIAEAIQNDAFYRTQLVME